MPFKSKSQMKYLYSEHPKIAEKWENEYHQTGKNLPNKVSSKDEKFTIGGTSSTNKK